MEKTKLSVYLFKVANSIRTPLNSLVAKIVSVIKKNSLKLYKTLYTIQKKKTLIYLTLSWDYLFLKLF